MGTYTWSRDSRWFNNLCGNLLTAEENDVVRDCTVCVTPLAINYNTKTYLDDVSTVSGAPRDIRGYGDIGSTPRFNIDEFTINHVGMRFESIAIPQGQTLTSAVLVFKMDGTATSETITIQVYCDDVDDAGELPTGSSLLTWGGFTKTSGFGSITLPGNISSGQEFTVDVLSPVQEIINRGGWASNNDMILLSEVQSGDNGFDDILQYDTTTTPYLQIVY